EAHDASYRQGQDNHNHQKDGHKFLLHGIDLQMISNCENDNIFLTKLQPFVRKTAGSKMPAVLSCINPGAVPRWDSGWLPARQGACRIPRRSGWRTPPPRQWPAS